MKLSCNEFLCPWCHINPAFCSSRNVVKYAYCQLCGEEFKLKPKSPKARFCSQSCRSKEIFNRPENVERSRQLMIELRKRKDVQIKLNAHLFGDSNPFKNPEIKRKAQDALREGGYWMLSGGNGTGPTRSQALLLAALGHEWILEYAVPTKETSGSGYPSSYKIDLCHPNKKLAIEIHGNSHRAKKVQERDKKKKEKLESLGWTVVAYWNNEIYNELDRVVAEVEEWLLNTAGP